MISKPFTTTAIPVGDAMNMVSCLAEYSVEHCLLATVSMISQGLAEVPTYPSRDRLTNLKCLIADHDFHLGVKIIFVVVCSRS